MKVALLSYEYPPETGFGGIGTYTWYQARALVRLGHDVRVIAGTLEPGTTHSEHDGVRVTRVLDPGVFGAAVTGLHQDGLGWAANRLQTAAGAHRALRDALEHEAFDLVEYPECGGDGMLVSTLLPVPTCVRFHSPARLIMGSYGADPRDIEATGFFEQIGIDLADVRISPSSFLAAEVVDRLGVADPVHVVPNGIDLELFDREPGLDLVDRLGLPSGDAVTILFSSRLERRKGAHLLPAICRDLLTRYPHVHIVIAGADDAGVVERDIRPPLDASGVGHRLHHLGRLGLHEVRALVRHVDIHLLPTLWDNAPYSCLEAMASARAIVTADCGGMPELIDHGHSGLLAATDDAASFVSALAKLVEDRGLRERLGDAARRAVEERYTDVATARRTVDVWQAALRLGAGPADER